MKEEGDHGKRDIAVPSLVALLAAGVCMLWVTAGSAQATCYGSTPNSASFGDALFDSGTASDIAGIDIDLDAGCGLAVDPVTSGLADGDSAFTYLNTDGNPTTGSLIFDGADKVVGVLGGLAGSSPPVLASWNGVTFDFTAGQVLPGLFEAGFITNLNQLGVPGPTTLGAEDRHALLTHWSTWISPLTRAPTHSRWHSSRLRRSLSHRLLRSSRPLRRRSCPRHRRRPARCRSCAVSRSPRRRSGSPRQAASTSSRARAGWCPARPRLARTRARPLL